MFRLLAIEWLKLRNYRPFWVLMVLFIVLLFLTNFVMSHGFFFKTKSGSNIFSPDYSLPMVWDYVGFWVRVLGGLVPVFIIISTTSEFQYRTNRQNVIDGWSRAEFFHAKWLSCLVVAVAITLIAAGLGAGFAFFHHRPPAPPPSIESLDSMAGVLTQTTDPHPEKTGHLDRLFFIFLLVLNYTGLAMTLSFFLKRGIVTVVLFLAFCYVLEGSIGWIINWRTHSHFGDYFPLQCTADLLALPTPDVVKQTMGPNSGPTDTVLAATAGGWLVFYYLVGWWKLRRSDW